MEADIECQRVYNQDLKTANFRKKRVTDTGLNKRIKLPDPVSIQKETKIPALVDDLDEVVMKAGKQAAA